MIGKNASIADMMTFEVMPNPNQITKSGTNATLGTTWKATISGRSAALHPPHPAQDDPDRDPADQGDREPADDSVPVIRRAPRSPAR